MRFLPLFGLAAVAVGANAFARDGLFDRLDDATPPTAEWTAAENACAMAATTILTGVAIGNPQENIALCNKHPDRRSCLTTKEFVFQRNNGDTKGLTCDER